MRASRALLHVSKANGKETRVALGRLEGERGGYGHDHTYRYLTDSAEPSTQQLDHARQFFTRSAKHFLTTTPEFRSLPSSDIPEVAFVGRSNIGKSSLINAVLGTTTQAGRHTDLARTSRRAGKTRYLSAYGVGDVRIVNNGKSGQRDERGERQFESWTASGPALVVLDTPGYGQASVPSWGEAVIKYLVARKQLRQAFVLLSPKHGIKDADIQMMRLLSEYAIPFQLILSKLDQVIFPDAKSRKSGTHSLEHLHLQRELMEHHNEAVKHGGSAFIRNVYGCSSELAASPQSQSKIGIASLRVGIMKVAGLDTGEMINKLSE